MRGANFNRRLKLSHDPNNTAWSRSSTKYGQKILQSHGWTPGKLLGASDAPYSDLHSASASHIRTAIKDDNLGLGAKLEAARASSETTGLDVYQDLLGRLNGRTAKVREKDRLHGLNLRSSAYIDQRWGHLRFVSGGLLVGAELRGLVKDEQGALNKSHQMPSHCSENGTQPEATRPQDVRTESAKRKKRKKRKTLGDEHVVKETSKGVDWSLGAQPPRGPSVFPERDYHELPMDMSNQVKVDKAQRRAERAERKLKRQIKRDARNSLEVLEYSCILPSPSLSQLLDTNIAGIALVSHPLRGTNTLIKAAQGLGVGRLAVRHRYIQHKKMCMMDNKALNEVSIARPAFDAFLKG